MSSSNVNIIFDASDAWSENNPFLLAKGGAGRHPWYSGGKQDYPLPNVHLIIPRFIIFVLSGCRWEWVEEEKLPVNGRMDFQC